MTRLAAARHLCAPLLLLACSGGEGETEVTSDTANPQTSATATTTTSAGTLGTETDGGGPQNSQIDVLFVISDVGHMAEEQDALSAGIEAFLAPLEAVGVDLRVAITTTDAGNPRCPKADTTPPLGDLLFSSCLDRKDDFFFYGTQPPTDAAYICADRCQLSSAQLQLTPTTTAEDPAAKARPWLQKFGEQSNLPAGVSLGDALRCALPQGISGCGFSSPLESMYLAIEKARTPGDNNYGFIRPNSRFAVVFVGNTHDCSVQEKSIFIDNKTFWNSPDDLVPTGGVCWRAGVACKAAGGGTYESCDPVDRGLSGSPTTPDSAVLHPLDRYRAQLDELIAAKTEVFAAPTPVMLFLIAGVPADYPQSNKIPYADGDDPEYFYDYGIGAGCSHAGVGAATPPVRDRVLTESYSSGGPSVFSICEPDLSGTLATIADRLLNG